MPCTFKHKEALL